MAGTITRETRREGQRKAKRRVKATHSLTLSLSHSEPAPTSQRTIKDE